MSIKTKLMSIKTRLLVGVLGAIFFLLISNLIAQYVFRQATDTTSQITNAADQKLEMLNQIEILSGYRAAYTRDLIIYDDKKLLQNTREKLKVTASDIVDAFNTLDRMQLSSQEKDYLEKIRQSVVSANQSFGNFTSAIDEGFSDEAKHILVNEFNPKFIAFSNIVTNFKSYEEKQNTELANQLASQQDFGNKALWSLLALSVIIFSIVGSISAKILLAPIYAMRDTMAKILETGDLSHRVPIYSKDEIGQSAQSINELLTTINGATNDVKSVMTEISNGTFKEKIENEYKGDFELLKKGVNSSYDQIYNMVVMLRGTASNLRNGSLESIYNEHVEMKGDYAAVITDIKVAMDAIRFTVDDISRTLDSLSKGDFSKRVEVEAMGEFSKLKNAINSTIDGLDQFVGEVVTVQSKISEGDLTDYVRKDYSGKMAALKDSLNFSTQNMACMIAKVGAVTKLVSGEASTIASSSATVSDRIQEQTIALEKTSTQMEEMTKIVQQNAEVASNANAMTQQAQVKLTSGVEIMKSALKSMDQMTEASRKINDIISIIDSIAFQTNLLALNAAVEAARAGDHGRGFAVVAGEVRSLAGKSSDAASEIKKLIENSVNISDESGRYVKQTSDALIEVNHSIKEMSGMISEIASASREQADGIARVNESILEMESSTQQNAGLIEESASGSQDLFSQSEQLLHMVQGFKVDETMSKRIARNQSSHIAQHFEKMIEAHRSWKSKIRGFINGMDIGVTYEVATDHTACILGKWYYGEGQSLMHMPLMQELGQEHMEMHQAIKKVMDAKEIGDDSLVAEGLTQIDKQSEKVVAILEQLEDEVS
ncbi:methyl-accepting chemotaxis protein [Hydrogenovibrio marinus]|uniref:Chemotaxis protein n=1 Tax=Hydrogenovibrio marinus TaxID=28885 RepID=A0A066ZSS2_HYDMR|nr:methyl-accepting chemotaxis protein [Hydrogenovibrio marinus]KDN96858.1 chemotaxis protein [Hydrogenovibrio marinus]BBN59116.1 methyl-accepting chemotaxis protein [Hydrogenovibrio marinus]